LLPGDVVGVALKDSIEHILLLCGLARAGIVLLPLDWRWTPAEQQRVLAHFGASSSSWSQAGQRRRTVPWSS
jgi:acyl-CoA synthetase (AMP-forming)/AMP-acid ligase II